MPRPVDFEKFLCRFLALGDGGPDALAKNLRPSAGQRIEPGPAQFQKRLLDGWLGKAREY